MKLSFCLLLMFGACLAFPGCFQQEEPDTPEPPSAIVQNDEPEQPQDDSNLNANLNEVVFDDTEDYPDKLYREVRDDIEVQFIIIDGAAKSFPGASMDIPLSQPLEEGRIYKAIASGVVLNGGVAGYLGHVSEIDSVRDIREVSLAETGLSKDIMSCNVPQTALLGDYAEGDFIFVVDDRYAVIWQNGFWTRRYPCCDGASAKESTFFFREGADYANVVEGTRNGIRVCDDYFVWPGVFFDLSASDTQRIADSSPLVRHPVFLPSKITSVKRDGSVFSTTEFSYDEHGNLQSKVEVDEIGVTRKTDYCDYDACGYPHKLVWTGPNIVSTRNFEYELDGNGLALSIREKENAADGSQHYEYYPDGTIKSYAFSCVVVQFDEAGKEVSRSYSNKPPSYSWQINWIYDPVTGFPICYERKYGDRSFSGAILCDENGNIISREESSGGVTNFEYVYIAEPSLYALSRSTITELRDSEYLISL